ncbi:MAG TPA: PAS domain-containing protein [Gemmatimonadales bacterium]|nr:PAS domain-containing protein [Gemmatimonadales bacterium]
MRPAFPEAVLTGRHGDVLERLGDAFLALDAEGRCTHLNGAAARLLRERYGAVHDPLVGRGLVERLPGMRDTPLDRAIRRARAELEPVTLEEHDAWGRRLETRVFPSEEGVSVLVRDVTADERSRLLMESVEDVVFRLDREQRCVDIFGRWLEREGYRPEQFLGRTTAEIVGPEAAPLHEIANLRALAGETLVYEWELVRPDGVRQMQTSLSPLCAADGSIVGIAGVGRDMTRRFAAEREIQRLNTDLERRVVELQELTQALQSEVARRAEAEQEASRWAWIFERAAWGVAIASADGERLEAVNPAFARMHGYSPDELRGRPVRDLFPERRHAELPAELRRAGRRGHHIWESEHRRKDGSVFPVLVDVVAITDAGGRVLCYAGTVQDLTDRHRAAEQMRLAQRTDAVGRVAGGITHDFNNLLMVILGLADILAGGFDPADPRRADAIEIRKAADRASGLARQLLTLGRPATIPLQVLDLNAVIRELDPLFRPLVPANVRLRLDLAPDLGGVAADRSQVEQVVVNLVLNARDAMPAGGELTIETREIELAEGREGAPPGPDIMLAVHDTGQGIDEATRVRVFEPFFSTKSSSRNAGLGLATVHAIVTRAGGRVWVDSVPDQGSTFRVCLPRAGEAPSAGSTLAGNQVARGSECVLVVEDEAAVRALACRTLAALGYAVLEAADGREALEVARRYEGAIDLVVTDVVMPELGGLELVEALGAERPEAAFLAMSGYLEPGNAGGAIAEAGFPFLAKPFSPESLGEAVRLVLDRRPASAG